METIEGTVAENDKDIALLQLWLQLFDDPIGGGLVKGRLSGSLQIGNKTICIEALLGFQIGRAVHFPDDDAMGSGKGLGKFLLEDGAASRVRAGLEEGPDA